MDLKAIQGINKPMIKSVYGKVGQVYVIQPCRNPQTGEYPKHIRPVDANGKMILSEKDIRMQNDEGVVFIPENMMIEFEPGKEFDLSNPRDKAIWEAIEYCPILASSRSEKDSNGNYIIDGDDRRYGVAELYIENPTKEAEKAVSKERIMFNAKSLIFNDPRGPEGRAMMAKVFGRDMTGYTDSDITDYLLKLAERVPQKVIDTYTGDDLSLRILFINAREKNVIRIKNKAYIYGDEGQFILGMSDEAVIRWMKNPQNNKILAMIKQETEGSYDLTLKVPEDEDKEPVKTTSKKGGKERFSSVEEALKSE